MKDFKPQIDPKEYETIEYIDKPRWLAFWHQIKEVANTNPSTVLEIGPGNGLVSHTLQLLGFDVTTVDFDKRLEPNIIGDVRNLPIKSESFDTILCAEVLEHLPFREVPKALQELNRVAKKFVILTIPHDYLTYFLLKFKIIPYIRPIILFKTIPNYKTHYFNGQHYWEIGKKGYPLDRIKKIITKAKFSISKTYCLPENPYHRFFILRKVNNL